MKLSLIIFLKKVLIFYLLSHTTFVGCVGGMK